MSATRGNITATQPSRASQSVKHARAVPLVAVVGGCGGAGASTLAVSLAITAIANGRRTVLFDADPLGGGLEQLVALATVATPGDRPPDPPRHWPHGAKPRARKLPRRDGAEPDLALVSWNRPYGEPIAVAAMRDALRALRLTADLIVVDLPRVLDDSAQLVLSEATNTLVVTPVSERAAVATSRLLPKLAVVGPPAEILARLPGRDNLTPRDLATLLDIPLAGVVRPGRGRSFPQSGASALGGRSAASLGRFSQRFLDRCAFGRPATDGEPEQVAE
jgi:secretion/DNA translocation related CpaE-like protein